MSARRRELRVREFDQRRRAAAMRELDPFAQQLPRLAAVVCPAQRRAQVDQRAGMLEPRRRVGEYFDRLSKQRLRRLAFFDETERTQRDADRPRRAPEP